MKQVKTSELSGVALRWAVSNALGHQPLLNMHSHGRTWGGWWESTPYANANNEYRRLPRYDEDWVHGGPIIDVLRPSFVQCFSDRVTVQKIDDEGFNFVQHGDTYLIAGMRCFVASELGDVVSIPEEL